MSPAPPRRSGLLRLWRLAKLLPLSVFCFIGVCLATRRVRTGEAKDDAVMRWIHWWFNVVMRTLGVTTKVSGTPAPGPVFYLPNHLGYLDIFAFGAAVETWFVTKEEILTWPVIGRIMRECRQPVVARRVSRTITGTGERIGELVQSGRAICPFLEGTSTGGDKVLPFRAALLKGIVDSGTPVQCCAIRWSCSDPTVEIANDVAYWKEEHSFGPHLLGVLALRGLEVEITFGPVIATAGRDRKEVAREARAEVLRLLGMPAEMDVEGEPEAEAS